MSLSDGARPSPDRRRMAEGIRLFLQGLGVDPSHPDLVDTPERVADAWSLELVDGYGKDPAALLAESSPVVGQGPVFVTHLHFVSVCPHHLLPFEGVAHVGYLPGSRLVGLSKLSRLVDCFAHRLTLQEELASQITHALETGLGAQGAGCVLVARHSCMAQRGVHQTDARVITMAWSGEFLRQPAWQEILIHPARGEVHPHHA